MEQIELQFSPVCDQTIWQCRPHCIEDLMSFSMTEESLECIAYRHISPAINISYRYSILSPLLIVYCLCIFKEMTIRMEYQLLIIDNLVRPLATTANSFDHSSLRQSVWVVLRNMQQGQSSYRNQKLFLFEHSRRRTCTRSENEILGFDISADDAHGIVRKHKEQRDENHRELDWNSRDNGIARMDRD